MSYNPLSEFSSEQLTAELSRRASSPMDGFIYERIEMGGALKDHPHGHTLNLKVAGDHEATRWLRITVAQALAITEILSHGEVS